MPLSEGHEPQRRNTPRILGLEYKNVTPVPFLTGVSGLRYPDLYELVTHYHREADGLCCALVRNAWRKDGKLLPPPAPLSLAVG